MSALPHPRKTPFSVAASPLLQVEGLTAGFGAQIVLRAVDLTVEAGTVTVVLGPNGAGKTTLVRAICGRLRPREGSVHICGIPAEDSAARHLIGFAPQEIALYRTLTIRENLETFARLSGVPARAVPGRVEQVLGRTGIAARAGERIDRLSGGWQRRANVAAALVGDPRLLVLDEPTVGIDAAARDDLATLVRHLADEGLGLVVVTHNFAFAERVADKIAILLKGRIALQGGLQAVLDARFARRRVVEVTFDAPPSAALAAQLAALGLVQDREPQGFHGLIADEARAVADLLSALEGLGAQPRAVALRAAGLDALYALVMEAA